MPFVTPNTFSVGEVADPSKVNANFAAITSELNAFPTAAVIKDNAIKANHIDATAAIKLTGDQSAAGTKTFTGTLRASNAPSGNTDVVNKAYIDALRVSLFGVLYTNDSAGNAIVKTAIYRAPVDGFLIAYLTGSNDAMMMYATPESDPDMKVMQVCAYSDSANKSAGFCVPVKKDWYFKVTTSGTATPTIRWQPIGANSSVVKQ